MIVYKSMISSTLIQRQQPYPYRTGFNRKSLIIVGISSIVLLAALIIS